MNRFNKFFSFLLVFSLFLTACSDHGKDTHSHNWGIPYYAWSDDLCTCDAIRICQDNTTHIEQEKAICSFEVVDNQDETNRIGKYTASFENPAFGVQYKYVLYNPDQERQSEGIIPTDENERDDYLDSDLPDYWQKYVETKMPYILSRDSLIRDNGDSFVFITDTHLPRNRMNSPNLIKYIFENSSIKKVVNCGDTLDIDVSDSGITNSISILQQWKNVVRGLDVIEVKGNHDNNNYNAKNSENAITDSQWCDVMLKPLVDKYGIDTGTHYVIDNSDQKMRYIILDSECSNYDAELMYLQEKLLGLTAGWTALIVQHRFWDSIDEVSYRGVALIKKINSLYNSLECKLAGVLVGHTHADLSYTDSTYGYSIIGTCCDARSVGNSGYDRSVGTTNEQCFDVVHIDYANEKIYMTRIGAGDMVVGNGTGVRVFSYGFKDTHSHNWGIPYYAWSDDLCTCDAIRICQDNTTHIEQEKAICSFEVVDNQDETNRIGKYTASFENPAFGVQYKYVLYNPDQERQSEGIIPTDADVAESVTYKHIVIFGIDGAGNYFEKVDTPNFDTIFSKGSINYNGVSQLPTISAENWESMFTGVVAKRHGINSKIAKTTSKNECDGFPTVFKICSEIKRDATFYSVVNWHPINDGLIENSIDNLTKENVLSSTDDWKKVVLETDILVADKAARRIESFSDTITFIHFDYVDYMCHKYGNTSDNYYEAIKIIDGCLKTVYDAYQKKGMLEDTLFIAVSDHGSIGTKDHGGESISEKKAMLAVCDKKSEIVKGTTGKFVTHDLASIILYSLGIRQPDYFDGRVPKNLFKKLR